MLTLLDSISLAGSRTKQNDDAWGLANQRAFVIDGATDLHDAPISGQKSDASWLARSLCQAFYSAANHADLATLFSEAAESSARKWRDFAHADDAPLWMRPLAAALILRECAGGVEAMDTGDCRVFAWDGEKEFVGGGDGRREESARAASLGVKAGASLDLTDEKRIAYLRRSREQAVRTRAALGLEPPAHDAVRVRRLPIPRKSHLLMATDGFASLVDVYDAYSPGSLVEAALNRGLAHLALELRDIESDDHSGDRFARWKRSDDATALLLRLD